jgi:hypothetical protein
MSAYVNPALQVQAPAAELELGAFEFEGQAEQELAPTASEYEFTGHAPQAAAADAPTVTEYVPAPQSTHAALPVLVLYFPATHRTHAPTGPVLPAAQSKTHAANAVLPAGDTPFTPHAVQASVALTPIVPEYVPAEHCVQATLAAPDHVPAAQYVHAALPVTVLYLPATHAEQNDTVWCVYKVMISSSLNCLVYSLKSSILLSLQPYCS